MGPDREGALDNSHIWIVETDGNVVELAATTAKGDISVITAMTKEGDTFVLGQMTQVTITGWSKGLNKVQLSHLLRQHAGCGLGEAKRAVDDLLAGERLTYDFSDLESASAFCQSASAVGAVCSTVAERPESDLSPSATTN
jgi:hypothetical protein